VVKVVGLDERAVKRVTCKSCASILEYTLSEVKSRRGTDWSGGSDGAEWVDCPKCGWQAIIKSW